MLRNRADSVDGDGFDIFCEGNCGRGLIERNVAARAGRNGLFIWSFAGSTSQRLRVLNNQAIRGQASGFALRGGFLIVQNNKADANGNRDDEQAGFVVEGDGGSYDSNLSRFNVSDGFLVDGNGNTFRRNQAVENAKDGFDVRDGTGNLLEGNQASRNEAEGFENNATDTRFRGNTSKANRIDCANSGTIAQKSGNQCADGSNFDETPEVEVVKGSADKQGDKKKVSIGPRAALGRQRLAGEPATRTPTSAGHAALHTGPSMAVSLLQGGGHVSA